MTLFTFCGIESYMPLDLRVYLIPFSDRSSLVLVHFQDKILTTVCFQEQTVVGCPNEETRPDIQLSGLGIQPRHCVVQIEDNEVYVTPEDGARWEIMS